MNVHEAISTAAVILGIFVALAAGGMLGLQALAWAWYRHDGGKLGFWDFLRGI